MQLLLLRYREEIIEAKVGQEHAEDTKRSEILFLKDQVRAEQQERNTVEETLSQEITGLQEELGEWEGEGAVSIESTTFNAGDDSFDHDRRV
jgi:predicted  nucleic acid-binding Zn-ribbon protein